MGADWYEILIVYGYRIKIPEGETYRKYIRKLDGLNGILKPPFIFTGLNCMFHSRVEGAGTDELDELSEGAHPILGFYVNEGLEKATADAAELRDFIQDNPILEGIEIADKPLFYSGIDWWDIILNSACDDSDSESESEDEGESESDSTDMSESDEDEDEDENNNEEDDEANENNRDQ